MNCYADRTESWLTMMGRGSEREGGRKERDGYSLKYLLKIGQSGMQMKYFTVPF